jgi:hypothetical protein
VGIPLTESRPLTPPTIAARLAALDWPHLERSLDDEGYAHTPPVLSAEECAELTALYDDDRRFRSRVDMARHRFGLGDYKYFQRPLPRLVQDLRTHAYPYLAAIANRWMAALGREGGFPLKLEAFLETCAAHGQTEPTPLLLHYEAGGHNCLHQDLYGDVAFPLQITAFLTPPGAYEGGEFLLVEQRPRAQSIGHAVRPGQGELVVFPTRERPAPGRRGPYRCQVRHGVSRLRAGRRYTLGIIFHDAR